MNLSVRFLNVNFHMFVASARTHTRNMSAHDVWELRTKGNPFIRKNSERTSIHSYKCSDSLWSSLFSSRFPVRRLFNHWTFPRVSGWHSFSSTSYVAKNLQSTLAEPDVVSVLLEKEINKGYVICPFSSPPFSPFRINSLCVATRKYSGKKR